VTIETLKESFTVCKLTDLSYINLADFTFIGKTDSELSLVCPTANVPQNITDREDGWKAMRIVGTLDFSLIGILAKIAAVLAEKKIGIYVVSTYDTDYVLVKSENLERAVKALSKSGYTFI